MGFLDRLLGRKKPALPKIPKREIGMGHRGIAAGDLEKRREASERYLRTRDPADRPWTQEEIDRWKVMPASEVRAFVYEEAPLTVHSTNVRLAQYFPQDQKMMVEFHSGHAYLYNGVTIDEAIGFANAQSKGGFLWDTFRVRGSRTRHKKSYIRLK